ncbi:RICIN domain-containing protein [Crossiella sp. SN42]|uniref:RICIN domain-containing protein n=1 Tax=Crossiella sp. SN42 TaxID=2944808 RepID=UPI00207D60F5|nr:RICIN domain-containing protein [Crossiella sp. SN42]MCO1576888.1 RICIN domain-containing protein [Crossiella sp. SN42]
MVLALLGSFTTTTVATAATEAQTKDGVFGRGWQSSGDRLWTTTGDADGFHLLVADAAKGYGWRTAATLSRPGMDTDRWIGNACLTASGRHAVVVYAPRAFAADEQLFARGGYTAVVDLDTGQVRDLPVRTTLAYFNPGCGAADTVALTQAGEQDLGKTRVLTIEAATGKERGRVEIPGQATSAVPAGDSLVIASAGQLERVEPNGVRRRIAPTKGVAHRLLPDAQGGVVFTDLDGTTSRVRRFAGKDTTTLATGTVGDVGTTAGAGGRVFIHGGAKVAGALPPSVTSVTTPAQAQLSTLGRTAVTGLSAVAGQPSRIQLDVTGTGSQKSIKSIVDRQVVEGRAKAKPANGSAPAAPAAQSSSIDDGAVCSVLRNDPHLQVYQPSPRQVEWAVDYAVVGELKVLRPPDWKGNGLGAYRPQDFFPLPALRNGGRVPAQVMLGVLGQESNLWQAKRHVLPGQTGNPLVGNYYGVDYYNESEADDWTIRWDKADCGYGVGQVTDGMRQPGKPHPNKPNDKPRSLNHQVAIATDYAANVAASLQILVGKWNELQAAGVTVNNNDPAKPENWFYALWAYNSGYHVPGEAGANGAYGLGWGNNPVNPKYPPDRRPFGKSPSDFAKPQQWPYPEKVLGFASNPPSGYEAPGMEVPFFRAAWWGGGELAPLYRDLAKPPVRQFCDSSNDCFPDRPWVPPTAPEVVGEPAGPCHHVNAGGQRDLKCWYHKSATWKDNCAATCGNEFLRFEGDEHRAEEPVRRDSATKPVTTISYPPRCVTTGLPVDALVIDNLPNDVPPVSVPDCYRPPNAGSFELDFARDQHGAQPGKIDLHQVGGGFGAHFWTSEAKVSPRDDSLRITGTWALNRRIDGVAKVYAHIPDHLAVAEVKYEIETALGTDVRTVRQADAEGSAPGPNGGVVQVRGGNRWVRLGFFQFSNMPKVRLSNINARSSPGGVAFDAIAVVPGAVDDRPDDVVAAIVNGHSEKCMVVDNNSTAERAVVEQRGCVNTFTDHWTVRYDHYGAGPGGNPHNYRLINRSSGKCLAVPKDKKEELNTVAVQVDCANADYVTTWGYGIAAGSVQYLLSPTGVSNRVLVVAGDSLNDDASAVLGPLSETGPVPVSSIWNAKPVV